MRAKPTIAPIMTNQNMASSIVHRLIVSSSLSYGHSPKYQATVHIATHTAHAVSLGVRYLIGFGALIVSSRSRRLAAPDSGQDTRPST